MSKIFYVLLTSLLIPDDINNPILSILNGDYNISLENLYDNTLDENYLINGLIEVDGEKSKNFFLEYYNSEHDAYDDYVIVKIAEFYYSKGLYIQSSNWYKKIPNEYRGSKYVDVAMNYYLNSLMIAGEKDSVRYYTKKFSNLFSNIEVNKNFIEKKTNKIHLIKKTNKNYIYTVQIGNFNNYQLAKKRKKYLSNLGFLCRIDEVYNGSMKSYSVRIGNFKDKELALKEQNRLKSRIGIYDSIVIRSN